MSKSAGWLSPFNGQPPRLSRDHHLRPEMRIPIFYYFCNVTRFGDDAASFACRSDTGDDNESSKWPRDTCQANRARRRSTINTRQFRLPRPPSIPTCLISSSLESQLDSIQVPPPMFSLSALNGIPLSTALNK